MRNASSILNQRPAVASAVITFVFMLGLAPKAHAQQHCSNASLRGVYGFHAFSTEVPTGTLRNVIGVYAFDGRGSWTATLTVNLNGSVLQFPDAGTYQVNPDCTGKLVLNSGGSQAAVVVDGGKELYLMRTDPSSIVQYGTGKKLFPGE
jgi:hypothetical protein